MAPDAQALVCEYTEPVEKSSISNCRLKRERMDENPVCDRYISHSEGRLKWISYNIQEAQQLCPVIHQVRGLRAYVTGNPDPVMQIS